MCIFTYYTNEIHRKQNVTDKINKLIHQDFQTTATICNLRADSNKSSHSPRPLSFLPPVLFFSCLSSSCVLLRAGIVCRPSLLFGPHPFRFPLLCLFPSSVIPHHVGHSLCLPCFVNKELIFFPLFFLLLHGCVSFLPSSPFTLALLAFLTYTPLAS